MLLRAPWVLVALGPWALAAGRVLSAVARLACLGALACCGLGRGWWVAFVGLRFVLGGCLVGVWWFGSHTALCSCLLKLFQHVSLCVFVCFP